jgi:hypothetical protein
MSDRQIAEATGSPVSKATARPWEVYDRVADGDLPHPGFDGEACCIRSVTDRDADWIAEDVHRNADAALIVRAVNEYEALIDVAQAALEITYFECGGPGTPLHDAKLAIKEKLARLAAVGAAVRTDG